MGTASRALNSQHDPTASSHATSTGTDNIGYAARLLTPSSHPPVSNGSEAGTAADVRNLG